MAKYPTRRSEWMMPVNCEDCGKRFSPSQMQMSKRVLRVRKCNQCRIGKGKGKK